MKKIFQFAFFLAISSISAAQKTKIPLTGFLHGQINVPLYDKLIKYCGPGASGGFQLLKVNNHKLKPQIDITLNTFVVTRIIIFENGETTGGKEYVVSAFVGCVYAPVERFETGLSTGLVFHQNGKDLGLKPYVAFYLGKKKKVKAHTSVTHIFERNNITKKNSGFISAGLAIRIF